MRNTVRLIPILLAVGALGACDETKTSSSKAAPSASFRVPPGQEAPADVAAAPADAQKTAGGTAFKVLVKGTGDHKPTENDAVALEYTAWTPEGKPFGSSKTMGRPARVGLAGVVPGLAEVLQDMTRGEERRIWIPAAQALKGWPHPPEATAITMDVKVIDIIAGPKKIPVPEDVAAPPADAKKTKTGLASKVLSEGTGKVHPKASDTVKVHYSGWTTDGSMFDSSEARGQPASFPLNGVIAGWTEGVQLMVEGEKRRFWIPVELAYNNMPGKPAGMLVFDIELLKIVRPPETPKDVAKPPTDAKKTESGLYSKVLVPGKGTKHPTATSRVKVEYSGWTTDGKMFDSSITRGQPASFSLMSVIAGWTEGLQLMVEGEQRRLWIPEELAYKGQRGKPKGMLVFDVELLEIQ
ncbi:MAG TPA: FKBP-type peptidyl-prolyl cis-trans isomerase [Polyangiaceae bacterium]|jgi:FKBP-type peptidyl-prolyl cis-trans isomerase|nr:MAG: putative FKBP-type peptidyl-prolyl cis-trans isomerase FkpA precursor [Deltaproteobacteria bacterium ADurb.Bin207]HNS95817.1 FKBP-type peptidyl-prolyl cis-trans isomerase [Polyangiaceae bacterium]HNZ24646.1 FKBP-type peptidyl-prolyl cis-trans isomerase [Polyangiaceae bacterium]HOD23222.1 FKBP-type peptidyl-prolyl cis-trans isomerase [Polyangiaceae bacterium]HOE51649.1 FKBP-type peptidyl-prolyl cis-trans isomerase [Polyangiaceae bacterium]